VRFRALVPDRARGGAEETGQIKLRKDMIFFRILRARSEWGPATGLQCYDTFTEASYKLTGMITMILVIDLAADQSKHV